MIASLRLAFLLCLVAGCRATAEPESPIAKADAPIPITKPELASPITEEERKAFAWFDTLGFSGAKDVRLVRVATGQPWQRSRKRLENTYHYGFLLEIEEFQKTADTVPEHQRIGYEPRDLKQESALCLADLRREFTGDVWHREFGLKMDTQAEAFLLAWACWRNGHDELAHALFQHTGGQATVAKEMAHAQYWDLVEAFGKPAVSRQQLLDRFEKFIERFPEAEEIALARDTAIELRQLVQEDSQHARRVKPFEQMTRQEQIAELVFQLRNQNGGAELGFLLIFDPSRDKSATGQLAMIGYDAVPQLIDALGDRRLTRCVGNESHFKSTQFVLRVGQCVEVILNWISGGAFYRYRNSSAAVMKDEETAALQERAKAWHAEAVVKGKRQMLIEAVERGDDHSPQLARRLVERYPKAALPAIAKATSVPRNEEVYQSLVRAAADIPGDEPVAFLLAQLEPGQQFGPSIGSRLDAAYALLHRKRPEALPAIIALWNGWFENDNNIRAQFGEDPYRALQFLGQLLATSTSLQAVQALRPHLAKSPGSVRMAVVELLHPPQENIISYFNKLRTTETPQWREAVEVLLVSMLNDREDHCWLSYISPPDNEDWVSPRVCDAAAQVLKVRWPEKYSFDFGAVWRNRDRAILAINYHWRKEQGLEPLPPPKPLSVPAVPDDRVAALTIVEAGFTESTLAPHPDSWVQLQSLHGHRCSGELLLVTLLTLFKNVDQSTDLQIMATRIPALGIAVEARLTDNTDRKRRMTFRNHYQVRVTGQDLFVISGDDLFSGPDSRLEFIRRIDEALASPIESEVEIRATLCR